MSFVQALGSFAIFLSLGAITMQSLRPAKSLRGRGFIAAPLLVSLCACTGSATHRDWQSRFSGDAIVMLGEVHDNAEQHHLRLERLRQAFAEGWRPVIAME